MPCFIVAENMKIETENSHFEPQVNEEFKAICISLLVIQSQISAFKTNLISANNAVKINGVILFENKIQKLLSSLPEQQIDPLDLVESNHQSTSSRLEVILQKFFNIKELLRTSDKNANMVDLLDVERQIRMLIEMLTKC